METELVALVGPDTKPTAAKYRIIELSGNMAKLEDSKTGHTLRVHKSRIMSKKKTVSKSKPAKKVTKTKKETFKCPNCDKVSGTKSGLTLHLKACSGSKKKMTQAQQMDSKDKPAKKTTKKTANKVDPVDMKKIVSENGGEHWAKGQNGEIKFDHAGYKIITHAILNEKAGYYLQFNTYTYPDGITSLGKGNKGLTKYPLKGKKITYTVSQTAKKEESRGQKRQRVGTKTAEEMRKQWQKASYKKLA